MVVPDSPLGSPRLRGLGWDLAAALLPHREGLSPVGSYGHTGFTGTMLWEQLAELRATGLFDIESHSYWHPNFHIEKRRLPADEYARFVKMQLDKSREVLDRRLNIHVDLLAWPFGIYDDDLIAAASRSGYVAGLTIERRKVLRRENVMTIPRFIVTDRDERKAFEALLPHNADGSDSHSTNNSIQH